MHSHLLDLGVRRDDGCLIWPKATNREGYGVVKIGGKAGKLWLVHRAVMPDTPLPIDHVCHTLAVERGECEGGPACPHRPCFEPSHLEPVTVKVNSRRGLAGRRRQELALLITHCPHDHEYTEENTYRPPQNPNHRMCRTCMRKRRSEWGKMRRLSA